MNRRPNFPLLHLICLQIALRALLNFWKAELPTIVHGLLFGGCLKCWAMAAQIALRDETLNSVPILA